MRDKRMLKAGTSRWLIVGAAAMAVAFAPLPTAPDAGAGAVRTFRVEASQFAYTPGELHVDPGDVVTIDLVSTDVVHGLYVDGYDVSVQADPGQTSSLTFVADRVGSFRLRCNVTCGAMHPFMVGRLTVGNDTPLYRAISSALVGALGLALFSRRRLEDGSLE